MRAIAALLFAVSIVSFGVFAIESSAAASETEAAEARSANSVIKPNLTAVPSRSVLKYSSHTITLWGSRLSVKALLIGDSFYIPLRAFSEKLGLKVTYNSAARTTVVSGTGINLSVSDGTYVIYANERPIFSGKNSAIMSDGRMYVPIEALMKAYGLSYSRNTGGGISVYGTYKPLLHAKNFYRSDEVLWLARIISAESRGEPLLGQIAVGTVVMNRVASKYYPNTIYGVIFDKKYGVQFSPVQDGSIYNTPTYNCTLAAKICLEGVRVTNNVLFFLRPETSNSLWIPASRSYLFSIGNHDFYA